MVNRSALTVLAKQPFIDWINNLPEQLRIVETVDTVNQDSKIYLLPETRFPEVENVLLKSVWERIFDEQLCSWWEDESNYPENRSYEMFNEWFDVKFHSEVEDLTNLPLLDE